MHHKYYGQTLDNHKIIEILIENLYNDLYEVKDDIKLARILFGYFDRCFMANKVLAKYNFFLKFFKQQDMYRFLIKKKSTRKKRDH